MFDLHGVVQHYTWGSTTALPAILQRQPDGRPWAEYWIGTHDRGHASTTDGDRLADRLGPLPYLVKLLAASQPLSLQTHPSGPQAADGFAAEQRRGIAADAPTRTYRDPFAKPELLIALTRFDALCGFRPVAETVALLDDLGLDTLANSLRSSGIVGTLVDLFDGTIETGTIVAAVCTDSRPEAALAAQIAARYPDEPSAALSLLLNLVTLSPGQAVRLTPGNLHAYVGGVGLEVMGPSDNVIRGGMTDKHVDVHELLRVLDPTPLVDPVVEPIRRGDRWHYPTGAFPFTVDRYDDGVDSEPAEQVTIWVCTSGPESGRVVACVAERFQRPDGQWFAVGALQP